MKHGLHTKHLHGQDQTRPAKPSSPSPAWARASCPQPKPCLRRCCPSSTSRSSVRRGGGQGSRHRAVHLRHRPRQARHRGPFRPRLRAREPALRPRQDGGAEQSPRRPADDRLGQLHAPAEAVGARPCGVVRAPSRRRRAFRGAAARRSPVRKTRRAQTNDSGLREGRRRHDRPRRKRSRARKPNAMASSIREEDGQHHPG